MLGNTFGRVFRVTACGESYGDALLCIVDGVPAGMALKDSDVQVELDRRRPGQTPIDSPRMETDQVKVVSGLLEGKTTGAPVGMIIYNVDRHDIHVQQYRDVKDLIRPGHAEYTYFIKYDEYADWCGAGRASGRETCMRVAAGALAKMILATEGIKIVGYTKACMGIQAENIPPFDRIAEEARKNIIVCPDQEAAKKMIDRVMEIKDEGETAGGIIEVIARGVPPGLGEPVFDKLNACFAHALMSIGAIKGLEFGAGFKVAEMKGSESNDIPYLENGRVRFKTNNSGGFLGGISNGEDLVMRLAVKPTSTVSVPQQTVDMEKMQETTLGAITRRDPTLLSRIIPVAEAMVAMTLVDHLIMWRGYDSLQKFEHKWR
ncbi:MAG TPA: chorismate synthase [Armatimonadota bacterium]|nr:chorismate synthase [Armatimonadota bacterium]